jgi:type II secretory pathway pseudopilin PulG
MSKPHPHFPLSPAFRPRRSARALTLIELLTALAVASLLIGSVVTTFVMILRVTENSEAQLNAAASARFVLEAVSTDMKALENNPGRALFIGESLPLAFGDAIDNDADGRVDEELPDGLDNDGDRVDHHGAVTGGFFERPRGVGIADLGDLGVDEDGVFSRDRVRFRTIAPVGSPWLFEDIEYSIQTFDDQPLTLVKTTTRTLTGGGVENVPPAPLAFQVLSFNLMYWDSNASAADQTWLTDWDSRNIAPGASFLVPASIYAEVEVYADPRPFESHVEGQKVQTIKMRTAVNVENVILDAGFDRN